MWPVLDKDKNDKVNLAEFIEFGKASDPDGFNNKTMIVGAEEVFIKYDPTNAGMDQATFTLAFIDFVKF